MSVKTDLEAELAEKVTEYRAAKVAPSHSVAGVTINHDKHRADLLAEIRELRELIILEGGAVVTRTQMLG